MWKQTDLSVESLEEDLIRTQNEVKLLRKHLNDCRMSLESLEEDSKLKFYTGLDSFKHLKAVFDLIAPRVDDVDDDDDDCYRTR